MPDLEVTRDGLIPYWGAEPGPYDDRIAEDALAMQRVVDQLRESLPPVRELERTAKDNPTREAVAGVYRQLRERIQAWEKHYAGHDVRAKAQTRRPQLIGRVIRPREVEDAAYREAVREYRALAYQLDPVEREADLIRIENSGDLPGLLAYADAPAVKPLISDPERIEQAREKVARGLDPEGAAELDALESAQLRMSSNWASFTRAVHEITNGRIDLIPGASDMPSLETAGAA